MKKFNYSRIPSYIIAIAEDIRDRFYHLYLAKIGYSDPPSELTAVPDSSDASYWSYSDDICRLMYDLVSENSINIMVSPHFSLREILSSDAAKCHNVKNDDFTFRDLICAVYLIYFALEPIRTHYNRPVTVTSFYRNKELNRIVGGVPNSRHLTGCAADIKIPEVSPSTIFRFCIDRNISNIKYDTFNHIQVTTLYE